MSYNYYVLMSENSDDYQSLRPLVDWLSFNGVTVHTRPKREFTDAEGRRRFKGDTGVKMAVDVMRLAPLLDHVILFTGDGDFTPVVDALKHQAVFVTVISSIATSPPTCSEELRRAASQFVELDTIRVLFTKPKRDWSDEQQMHPKRQQLEQAEHQHDREGEGYG